MAQSLAFAVFATLICQINSVFPCKDTKRYSAGAEFLDSLLLVVAQSFGCGTELWFVTQSFACGTELWYVAQSLGFAAFKKAGKFYFLQSSQTKGRDVLAAFATLVCQRNCVFLCKGTKLKNSACAEFLDSLLLVVAQSFAFAVFATLICQINSVFPCKDTKALFGWCRILG